MATGKYNGNAQKQLRIVGNVWGASGMSFHAEVSYTLKNQKATMQAYVT